MLSKLRAASGMSRFDFWRRRIYAHVPVFNLHINQPSRSSRLGVVSSVNSLYSFGLVLWAVYYSIVSAT